MPTSCCDSAPPPPPTSSEPRPGPVVLIGDRAVGADQPTYVIAEAGVNHDGLVEKALELVDAAVVAGADAVKFQVFRAVELATASASTAGYQQLTGQASQRQMLEKLELSNDEFERLRDHCRQRSIEFLATPFSPPDVERLQRLGVRAIKTASTDLNNTPLLRKVAATGLPLIVSTGAATAGEIRATVDWVRSWEAGRRLILLHCVSRYPTPLEAANLRAVAALRAAFGVPCGFSDHTTATQSGAWAVAAGACLLEKHFTLNRGAPGPDHAMSLSPAELAEYIAAVRAVETALGSGELGMTELETDVRAVARRSVVAATSIRARTVLTPEMLTVKRPGGGIEPDQLEALVGRCITTDVPSETMLTWDMIA